jgi:type IV secretory pathway VirB4 component
LYLKYYANAIGDDFMKSLTGICPDMMLSVDILPVPADEAVREAESRLLGIETNITGWQRKQNRSSNFSAAVPYDLQLQRKETREFLEDLASRDQRMMLAVITVMVSADDQKELDRLTESVMSFGRSRMCQIAELRFRQLEGLNTVLPVGARKIEAFRTLVTDSLAVFIPFRVQEISETGGIYMGMNAVSGNPLFCNRERLMNQSAFLLGVPGSGKSFLAKQMIMSLLLGTDDDILICDPEGEYVPIAEAAADQGRTVRISAHSGDRINPMYMDPGETDRSSVIMKSELI